MVSPPHPDLWPLVLEHQWISPTQLADAIQRQAAHPPLDFRTRLLIRDSLNALRQTWGEHRLSQWLADSPQARALSDIDQEDLGSPGFPSLPHRLMEPTQPDTVLQFLRDLGQHLPSPASINIGGSTALILADLLSRATEDIDVVDEVPTQIRTNHALLDQLAQRYALKLTHFQSHYLPTGWDQRLRDLGTFDRLHVHLVDPLDIFVGKLFSSREKDRDDLRALTSKLEKSAILQRIADSAQPFFRQALLRDQARKNWYVLHGEQLPS